MVRVCMYVYIYIYTYLYSTVRVYLSFVLRKKQVSITKPYDACWAQLESGSQG